jgi:hypothetical protein
MASGCGSRTACALFEVAETLLVVDSILRDVVGFEAGGRLGPGILQPASAAATICSVVLTAVGQIGFGTKGALPELFGFPVVVEVDLEVVVFWFDSVAQITTRLPVIAEPVENPVGCDVVQLAWAACGCKPTSNKRVAKSTEMFFTDRR